MPKQSPPPFALIYKFLFLFLVSIEIGAIGADVPPAHSFHIDANHGATCQGLIAALRARNHYEAEDGDFHVTGALDESHPSEPILTINSFLAFKQGNRTVSSTGINLTNELKEIGKKFAGRFHVIRVIMEGDKHVSQDANREMRQRDLELAAFNQAYNSPDTETRAEIDAHVKAGVPTEDIEKIRVAHALRHTSYFEGLALAVPLKTVEIDKKESVGTPGQYKRLVLKFRTARRP